ncbi:MAG: 50S ribosomal protein L18Ae [Thermoplasmata archaeon]
MKIYRVFGTYTAKGKLVNFKKDVVADSKNKAIDKVFAIMGSYHNVKRRAMKIEEVTNVSESKDPKVLYDIKHGEK